MDMCFVDKQADQRLQDLISLSNNICFEGDFFFFFFFFFFYGTSASQDTLTFSMFLAAISQSKSAAFYYIGKQFFS